MAQLNFYVPDKIEAAIRQEAQAQGESISSFLANLVKRHFDSTREWHPDFFTKVVGSLKDFPDDIERPLPESVDWE